MPRYHFHVYDGRSNLDRDGTDLPDIRGARVEALRLAAAIIADGAAQADAVDDLCVEVTDDVGLMLFRMDFAVVTAPAESTLARTV